MVYCVHWEDHEEYEGWCDLTGKATDCMQVMENCEK